jgi:hypothetical protein
MKGIVDMAEIKHRVIIDEAKYIPTIGKGPIRNPIMITDEQYKMFKILGIKVTECEDVKLNKIETEDVVKEEVTEVEETVEEEITDEESVEDEETVEEDEVIEEDEASEEVTEEDISESIMIDDVDINSLTKKQIKAKLTELGISYSNNANLNDLRVLLIQSVK